jgi:ketosteroid isomerase-like protein
LYKALTRYKVAVSLKFFKGEAFVDFTAEKARLLERDAEWAAAAAKGEDIEHILSYWTDDAVVMPPGAQSIIGKDQLRRYVESSLQIPGFKITWASDDVEFSPDGNLAYMFSRNEVTVTGADGTPVTIPGRAVTIWRRDAVDNEWRCALDIWNAES